MEVRIWLRLSRAVLSVVNPDPVSFERALTGHIVQLRLGAGASSRKVALIFSRSFFWLGYWAA